MAVEKKRGDRESKKPKKPVLKTIAAAFSSKGIATSGMTSTGRG